MKKDDLGYIDRSKYQSMGRRVEISTKRIDEKENKKEKIIYLCIAGVITLLSVSAALKKDYKKYIAEKNAYGNEEDVDIEDYLADRLHIHIKDTHTLSETFAKIGSLVSGDDSEVSICNQQYSSKENYTDYVSEFTASKIKELPSEIQEFAIYEFVYTGLNRVNIDGMQYSILDSVLNKLYGVDFDGYLSQKGYSSVREYELAMNGNKDNIYNKAVELKESKGGRNAN